MTGQEMEAAWEIAAANIFRYVAENEGVTLRGINLKRTATGWLLVVSVTRGKGIPLVGFFGAPEPEQCFQQFFYQATHKPGVRWVADKFAK